MAPKKPLLPLGSEGDPLWTSSPRLDRSIRCTLVLNHPVHRSPADPDDRSPNRHRSNVAETKQWRGTARRSTSADAYHTGYEWAGLPALSNLLFDLSPRSDDVAFLSPVVAPSAGHRLPNGFLLLRSWSENKFCSSWTNASTWSPSLEGETVAWAVGSFIFRTKKLVYKLQNAILHSASRLPA
jgi:hypothetical protein